MIYFRTIEEGVAMSEIISLFLNGTQIMFNPDKKVFNRNKTLDTKMEIRLAKARMKHSVLQRSSNRIKQIATDALS
jgi:hypothetical protein